MANFAYVNNVNTTLATPITTTGQTTVTLASSANLPTLSAGQMMSLTLNDASTRGVFEVVYVTAITGATLTMLRGQEGTAANTWLVGDLAYSALSAGVIQSLVASTATAIGRPSGRLSLASATPYPQANITAVSNIYYTLAAGATLPIYNGSSLVAVSFTEQIEALTSGNNLSAHIYDIFAYLSGSTALIGTGPAWSSLTARSAAIDQTIGGFWTNTNPIVLTNGATTTGTIPAGEATYLGTVYCTANGQTGMNFTPATASHGTANVLGLYNAYNRARVLATCSDNAGPTLSSNTWAPMGAGDNILWVDGLQQSMVDVELRPIIEIVANSNDFYTMGINVDTNSGAPSTNNKTLLQMGEPVATPFWNAGHRSSLLPLLGAHTVYAMLNLNTAGTANFSGSNTPQLFFASLEM